MMSAKDGLVHTFSRIYLYTFVMLFIYVVLSLFIAIIMDTYEMIKSYYDEGFPQSRYVAQIVLFEPLINMMPSGIFDYRTL